MAKIQVVIADTDDIYVEHLARYLMENAEQCEVSTFSAKDSFLRYICSTHTDILLIDRGMRCRSGRDVFAPVKSSSENCCQESTWPENFDSQYSRFIRN